MRKQSGFTLAELIAVLLLLAILAAVTASALTAYIRKAQEMRMIARARAALLAVQMLLVERYAAGEWSGGMALTQLGRREPGRAPAPLSVSELLEKAELPPDAAESIRLAWDDSAAVTAFIWTEARPDGTASAVWNGKSWEIGYDWAPGPENPQGFGNKD